MEAIFIYIAKASSLMLMFYFAYFFLLRKETFFNSNRWFLLSGLIISVILPLLSFTKVIWIDAAPSLQNFQSNLPQVTEKESEFSWNQILLGLYGLGFLVFIIKLAIDFYSLNSIIKGKKIQQQADFKFIDINENIAPFSYFEYIVYNSSLYTASELENIIEHEKVHSDQNHTVDVLISRIFSIIFWFNPIVWLYKKAITQNLEFIADSEAAKKLLDKKAYQYTLLKITTHENCVAITNHFYQSLIKKRIVMLNKNQSKKRNSWKYYVVIPALAAFVLLFQVEVIAKEKPQLIKKGTSDIEAVDVYKIKKSSTDADLKEIKEKLKSIHNIDFEASEIKRNAANELTAIKIDVINGAENSQSIQNAGNRAIKEFGIAVITDEKGQKKVGIMTDEKNSNAVAINAGQNNSDSTTNSSVTKILKTVQINNPTTNTKTNVNTNSNASAKNSNVTSSAIRTTVTTDGENSTSTQIVTKDGKTSISISDSGKKKSQGFQQLLVVNGDIMPADYDMNSLNAKDIETMNVLKGAHAVEKYGDKGINGVIEIETRK
ncbi:M56 family metallopeptidase [Flavobacterium olei]|uniref:M56 family metallopeptidase n=1 Tax=Flavobacterium olei TaxID=1886782 RepID=UPI0032191A2B